MRVWYRFDMSARGWVPLQVLHETLAALADPAERARRLELAQANVARWREQPEVVQPFVQCA